jgi:hypothetical protein
VREMLINRDDTTAYCLSLPMDQGDCTAYMTGAYDHGNEYSVVLRHLQSSKSSIVAVFT